MKSDSLLLAYVLIVIVCLLLFLLFLSLKKEVRDITMILSDRFVLLKSFKYPQILNLYVYGVSQSEPKTATLRSEYWTGQDYVMKFAIAGGISCLSALVARMSRVALILVTSHQGLCESNSLLNSTYNEKAWFFLTSTDLKQIDVVCQFVR